MADIRVTRRRFLQSAGILSGAAMGGGLLCGLPPASAYGAPAAAAAPLKTVRIAWHQAGICQAPISVAYKKGFFTQYGLQVETVNFTDGDTPLVALSTGQAEAGIGMALRWLKPLEQGFDVALTVGTHGGCMRLITARNSGITQVRDLVGKSVAVSDQASPVKNFFAIQLARQGFHPDDDVNWVQYPEQLSGEALRKGEVQAIAATDPQAWLIRERDDLFEVATNLSGAYHDRTCCVLALSGALVRNDPRTARAITQAVVDAQQWAVDNPDETAEIFAPFLPSTITAAQVKAILAGHTHGHHSTGHHLRAELAAYVDELKTINVIRPDTDTRAFIDKTVPDILSA
ncbi:ABC transporter substrate-binding protein [Acerihabitans arboris]|uniref:ABC transporter substrate-binding protein n=1 Tax=Acerihabitans arboris TaxID=2691583 RepID=A0A845SK81_9GAMM|nr:ABC transporter substrate-binding protein [Acerihabitans arboris]NDL63406.1 ABC transporter substrate-binding protein [Acerihabitans arboris]